MHWDCLAVGGFTAPAVSSPGCRYGDARDRQRRGMQRDDPASTLACAGTCWRCGGAEFGGQLASYRELPSAARAVGLPDWRA